MSRDGDIGRAFVDLADTLVEDYDLIEFLQMLTQRVVDLLGVSEAGVVLASARGDLRPLASSSERMRLLELFEIQRDDGPCLECWRTGAAVRADDLDRARERWPRFAPAALAAGFRSAYALPLRLRQERIGALNLFADHVGALDDDDAALGQAMADVATIGILHERLASERSTIADQLNTAFHSRIMLEQAKGMISEQAGIDTDEAFTLLRAYARAHDRKLKDVVEAVTDRQLLAHDLDTATSE